MAQIVNLLNIGIIGIVIHETVAAEVCSYILGTYCEDGYYCCDNDTQCCSNALLSIGAIVGIVIGGLVFFGFVIAVCCCLAQAGKRSGHVVAPPQTTGGVTVISSGHAQYPYNYAQHPAGPPQYGAPQYGTQHYGGAQSGPNNGTSRPAATSDPAYPPPPPPNYVGGN